MGKGRENCVHSRRTKHRRPPFVPYSHLHGPLVVTFVAALEHLQRYEYNKCTATSSGAASAPPQRWCRLLLRLRHFGQIDLADEVLRRLRPSQQQRRPGAASLLMGIASFISAMSEPLTRSRRPCSNAVRRCCSAASASCRFLGTLASISISRRRFTRQSWRKQAAAGPTTVIAGTHTAPTHTNGRLCQRHRGALIGTEAERPSLLLFSEWSSHSSCGPRPARCNPLGCWSTTPQIFPRAPPPPRTAFRSAT